jgi:uncharacterized membrane protein YedE/YeeE
MDHIVLFALLGIAYGYILQKSGFCFCRAAYEVLLLRTRDAVDGVMAGLLLATAGFAAVVLTQAAMGVEASSHLLTPPLGLNTLVGGALFGFGMTLAGMCAVGMLQRLGEGYLSAWAVLFGILLGALIGGSSLRLPGLSPAVLEGLSLTRWLHPAAASLLTLSALGILWLWMRSTGRSPSGSRADRPTSTARPGIPRLTDSPLVGGLLLGALSTLQMALHRPWTAGYPLAALTSILHPAHQHPSLPMLPELLTLNIGLVLGAMASAIAARDLRPKVPRRVTDIVRSLTGGILMGAGIRIGYGCALGGFFSSIPSLALSGWVYLLGMLVGAWVGLRVVAATA